MRKVKLSHSAAGLITLVLVEFGVLAASPALVWLLLVGALLGAAALLYVATEVIEEVRNKVHMLQLLSVVLAEFIIFFAAEYYLLLAVSPQSFPTLSADTVSLLLHSTMIFVFNPLYIPADTLGRALLLINTASALGLVLFIVQNIWQFRKVSSR